SRRFCYPHDERRSPRRRRDAGQGHGLEDGRREARLTLLEHAARRQARDKLMNISRRGTFTFIAGALALGARWSWRREALAAEELTVPNNVPAETFDFETKGGEGWTTVDGQWVVEEMAGAPSGKKVLVQRATKNQFNVIVAPPGPYRDADVSMKFKPISGREDASGGIVFRFNDGKYYVVRA